MYNRMPKVDIVLRHCTSSLEAEEVSNEVSMWSGVSADTIYKTIIDNDLVLCRDVDIQTYIDLNRKLHRFSRHLSMRPSSDLHREYGRFSNAMDLGALNYDGDRLEIGYSSKMRNIYDDVDNNMPPPKKFKLSHNYTIHMVVFNVGIFIWWFLIQVLR